MESDTTSHLRPSILTSFLSRSSRPRSTAASPTGAESPQGVPGSQGMNINNGSSNVLHNNSRRRNGAQPVNGAPHSGTHAASHPAVFPVGSLPIMPGPTATSFSQMLRRRRSNNGNLNQPSSATNTVGAGAPAMPSSGHGGHSNGAQGPPNASGNASGSNGTGNYGPPHRIRLVPHLENQRALHFDPITRECREGAPAIRIGRFTDRSGTLAASTNSLTGKIAFKSKVVSRGHAELWCEPNAKFYVKDTSSSSGTFLNHMRLSQAGIESRPFLLKDGDILQLGVDYQGGTEEIYRCVKIRVEIGREWQAGPNPFNTQALAQLKSLSNLPTAVSAPVGANASAVVARTKSKKSTVSDCCICLFPVTVCQALFIAPCSHSFHYKCIRGTLYEHHPGFSCPLCRSFHDLEADVEVDIQEEEEEWEELPEPDLTPAVAAEVADVDGADADAEVEAAALLLAESLDLSDGNGNANATRRSMDDEDDMPHGFRTAAEDNDTRRVLLPQGLHQSHPNVASASNTSAPMPRRQPRRGTMVQGQAGAAPAPYADDVDRGFDTDGGALGYGAETDMDVEEPSRSHLRQGSTSAGNSRNASTRNRSTVYNNNSTHGAGGANEHGGMNGHTYASSAGMVSAPNLLRPGSSLGHANQAQSGSASGPIGNTTPPTAASVNGPAPGAHASPVNVRPGNSGAHAQSYLHHALVHSSSNPGAPRAALPSSYPSGSAVSHLFGDSGAGSSNVTDKDREREELMNAEDHTVEGAGAPGIFSFGSGGKRKR